ncbi:MAG: hypothetical protein IKR17_07550 [Bacteroidales bacterium]|nr:hypothetical protein [Bacteroidales bacterium]
MNNQQNESINLIEKDLTFSGDKTRESVYKIFNFKQLHEPFIERTWWQHGNDSKYSDNSYSFSIDGIDNKKISKNNLEDVVQKLSNLFRIDKNEVFATKLKEVCNGNGNEIRKITTVHSSSLCALLFFYNVSEDNPIKINGVNYGEVLFEYKNKCIKDNAPSNIDIALVSTDKKTVLFLESKFSEYLTNSRVSSEISNSYKENELSDKIYSTDSIEKIFGEGAQKVSSGNYFKIKAKQPAYIDGIKQMISHYIGADNFAEGERVDDRLKKINAENVLLGTIVFDGFENNPRCEGYRKLYENFVKEVGRIIGNSKVILLSKPLTYKELWEENKESIDRDVASFYGVCKGNN